MRSIACRRACPERAEGIAPEGGAVRALLERPVRAGERESGDAPQDEGVGSYGCALIGLAHDAGDCTGRDGSRRERGGRPDRAHAEGRQRVAVPGAGAGLLHRLSGLADLPRPVAEFHRLPVPLQQAGALGLVRQLHAGAQRPPHVGEPVAGGVVHDDVSARNDHPAPVAGHPGRPGRRTSASPPSTG